MKRKQTNSLIPKAGISIIISLLVVLVAVGIYRDSIGETCTGFIGARSSCVEETALWPFGLMGFVFIVFFGVWWTINYTNKSIKSMKSKSKKKSQARQLGASKRFF